MKRLVLILLAPSLLLWSSAAWAQDTELYRWSFDTTGDAQNWNLDYTAMQADPEGHHESSLGYQVDTYDGTNYINLDGQHPDEPDGALLPTIDPATEGGALRLDYRGGWGYYELYGFKIERGLDQDVMKIQFNATTYLSAEHSQVWVDWYIREPADPWRVARMRVGNVAGQGLAVRGDVEDGEWWRTTYTVDDIKNAELILGTKWWEEGIDPPPQPFVNLNGVYAVNFVMNIHTPDYSPYFIDDIRLFGPSAGACCLPDGSCVEVLESACEGIWQGAGTTCDTVVCCPYPFADADRDGDVDQSDFAVFQVCMTGAGDPGQAFDPDNCACFDRDGDDDVDEWDLADFEACATGPDVPWVSTPACP